VIDHGRRADHRDAVVDSPSRPHRKLMPHASMELTMRNAKNRAMSCCLSMSDLRSPEV
jgi:hypothetical protein